MKLDDAHNRLLGNPVFGSVLILVGVLYLIFVGEPKSQLRSPFWSFAGWALVGVLSLAAFAIGEAGYVVSRLSPVRILSPRQAEIIKREAKVLASLMRNDAPRLNLTVYSVDTPEANAYAAQIMDALKEGGVYSQSEVPGLSRPFQTHVLGVDARGLFIPVQKPSSPPITAQALHNILADAGISSRYQTGDGYDAKSYSLTISIP